MASQVEAIKWVPGTSFLVDGFRFPSPACAAYFLTHGHSDHTTGLSSSWNAGPIYCSPVTARLLRHDFPGLRPDCLRVLELDQPANICGVEVTPIDANHCPGAVMFLFRVPGATPPSPAWAPPTSAPASAGRGSLLRSGGSSSASLGAAPASVATYASAGRGSLLRSGGTSNSTENSNGTGSGRCSGSARGRAAPAPAPAAGVTTILHTGDMRWHAGMAAHPALAGRQVDCLMMDTTYCLPKWAFPPQQEAVRMMADTMAREAAEEPATLFVVGSYHVGKERAFLGAAHQLGWRVHCTPAKQRLLRLLGLPPEWLALLTDVAEEAQIHVLGMGEQLHAQALAERIAGTRWRRVVAIKPTGWSFRPRGGLDVRVEGCVTLVGIPYSEHSSWTELRDCVASLRPKRIMPTVNATDAARSRAIVDRFADLMDNSENRSRLDCYLLRPAPVPAPAVPAPAVPAAEAAEVAGPAVEPAAGLAAAAATAVEPAAAATAVEPAAAPPPVEPAAAATAVEPAAAAPAAGSSAGGQAAGAERPPPAPRIGGMLAAATAAGLAFEAAQARAPALAAAAAGCAAAAAAAAAAEAAAGCAAGPVGAPPVGPDVDLESVDVAEQHRIWRFIQSQSHGKGNGSGGGGGPPAGGMSAAAAGGGDALCRGSSGGRRGSGAGGAGGGNSRQGTGGSTGYRKRGANGSGPSGSGGLKQPSLKKFFSPSQGPGS